MTAFRSPSAHRHLERELAWAHLKIQALTEELRQQRVKLLGPHSETLSDLQLELLADEEPGTTLDEVEAEARRAPLPDGRRRVNVDRIRDGNACRRICRGWKK